MNLSVFLSIGESIKDFKHKGQDSLFINNNLKNYSENFKKVYVFSYENESYTFFKNVTVIPNKYNLPRFIYAIILPLVYPKIIDQCSVVRGYQVTGGIPAILCKLLFRKKIVINYGYPYSEVAKIERKPFQALIFSLLNSLILPLCDKIIITTSFMRPIVKKYTGKIVLIPNGVDTSIFKPKKHKKSFLCIFVGRLVAQKNLPVLIRALSMLDDNSRSLLVIGDGIEREQLRALAKSENVRLKIITRVANIELPDYYNSAKIFVLPSLIEGHPKALIEAMACGIPTVANNVKGISTLIKSGENGLLFSQTPISLKKQLHKLLTNKNLYTKLSHKSREYVKNFYDFNILKKKEIELLKNI